MRSRAFTRDDFVRCDLPHTLCPATARHHTGGWVWWGNGGQ